MICLWNNNYFCISIDLPVCVLFFFFVRASFNLNIYLPKLMLISFKYIEQKKLLSTFCNNHDEVNKITSQYFIHLSTNTYSKRYRSFTNLSFYLSICLTYMNWFQKLNAIHLFIFDVNEHKVIMSCDNTARTRTYNTIKWRNFLI